MVARRDRARERLARARCIDDRRPQVFGIAQGVGEIDRHERARREHCAVHAPSLLELDQQTAGDHLPYPCLERDVERARAARSDDLRLARKERHAAPNELDAMAVTVSASGGRHADIGLRAARDLHRARQRFSALEALDHERIPRCGERAGLPFARDEQRVLRRPRDRLLAARKHETARHERCAREIELANRDGVFAAVRQADQTTAPARRLAVAPDPHPVLAFHLRERVEIEHRLPPRCRARVARERRGAPNAAHVSRVSPEIIGAAVDDLRVRDAVLGLADRARGGVEVRETRIAPQHAQRLGVLGLHPIHGAGAVHVFQPQKWIGGIRCNCGGLRCRRWTACRLRLGARCTGERKSQQRDERQDAKQREYPRFGSSGRSTPLWHFSGRSSLQRIGHRRENAGNVNARHE
jgi:hypothetical protein